jgi:hypothetical protein
MMNNSRKSIQKSTNRTHSNAIKLVHWNACGISTKQTEFEIFLINQDIDVCVVSETKWGRNSTIAFDKIDQQYNIIHKFRKNSGGAGGISMFVKKELNYLEINDFEEHKIEYICVKIFIRSKEYVVFGLYNPPNTNLPVELLKTISRAYSNCIFPGDLNCRSISIGCRLTNKNGTLLENFLIATDVQVMNNSNPTYHRHNSDYNEILDLFMCSTAISHELCDFEVMYEYDMTSDHYPIQISVKVPMRSPDPNKITPSSLFDYRKANWPMFKANLNKIEIKPSRSIDEMNRELTNQLDLSARISIPMKRINNRFVVKLPNFVLSLIEKRKELKKRIRKGGIAREKSDYNLLTRVIRDEIKSVHNESWSKFSIKFKGNPVCSKPFWQRVNKLRSNKTKIKSIPVLKNAERLYVSDTDKANLFAEGLAATFSDTDIPKFDDKWKQYVNDHINAKAYDERYTNKLARPFRLNELNSAIDSLKPNSASGISDGISNQMLKNTTPEFRTHLLTLFNRTISEVSVPSAWKVSEITMIGKKANEKSNPSNYRPISLTSCMGKLCEKLILMRLNAYLKRKN